MQQSLWQTTDWEKFQQSLGHRTIRVDDVLGMLNPLPLGFQYLYIPRGPSTLSESFWKRLEKLSTSEKLVFTRMDPEQSLIISHSLKAEESHSPQPETTLMLDLELSEEELLRQMKRKGRYNIGLAEKKGVSIHRAGSEEEQYSMLEDFYRLLQETTSRDAFSGHDLNYYKNMLAHVSEAEIYTAYWNHQPVSSAISVFHGETAIYYYGASSNANRETMASYLLQWEMIRDAKNKGCRWYDFLGIAPEGSPPSHPWFGITSFKKKFGGNTVSYPKATDIIHKTLPYIAFKILKGIQKVIR